MKHTSIFAACAFFTVCSPAYAQTVATFPPGVYYCQLAESGRTNWVPPEILLKIAPSGAAEVYDGFIAARGGKPIAAEIITDNDIRTTFGWTLNEMYSDTQQFATIDMRLTVMKANLSASINVIPLQYQNTIRGDGGCVRK